MELCPNCKIMVEPEWLEPDDDHAFIYGIARCPMCKRISDGMDWNNWRYVVVELTYPRVPIDQKR